MAAKKKTSGFACQECGHRFRTIKAAEKAAFGPNGCPRCGGSDIAIGAPSAPQPRYTELSVPGDGDEPATWFVYDREAGRSVRLASGFDDAREAARGLNAASWN